MTKQNPAFIYPPADVLTTAEALKVCFQVMLGFDSELVESCPNQALDRIKQNTSNYLRLLREAAEERGISSAPLIKLGTAWESLWRCYPDPEQAIKHFKEYIPEQELVERLTETVARLEDKARLELRTLPSRAAEGLHRLAERIEKIDQDNEIQMQHKPGTVGLCIFESVQYGAFGPPCPESVLESLEPALEKATSGDGGLIDAYDLAPNLLIDWLKSNGYWPQDIPPQEPLSLAGITKAIRTLGDKLAMSGTASPVRGGDESDPLPVDDDALMSPTKLAEVFGVNSDALRKRLERFRKNNHKGWIENTERKPKEAQFLYRVGTVRHIIKAKKASS